MKKNIFSIAAVIFAIPSLQAATVSFFAGVNSTGGFNGGLLLSTDTGNGQSPVTNATFTLGLFDEASVMAAGANPTALEAAFTTVVGSAVTALNNVNVGVDVPGTQDVTGFTIDDADFSNTILNGTLGLLVVSGSDVGFFASTVPVTDLPDSGLQSLTAFDPVEATALVGSVTNPGVDFGQGQLTSSFQLEAVPEPSAGLLGLAGGLALIFRRRR